MPEIIKQGSPYDRILNSETGRPDAERATPGDAQTGRAGILLGSHLRYL